MRPRASRGQGRRYGSDGRRQSAINDVGTLPRIFEAAVRFFFRTGMSSFDQTILDLDSWLEPFLPAIAHRHQAFIKWKNTIQEYEGGYDSFTKGFLKFGLNVQGDASVVYREWAPNATEAVIIGDFSSS